MTELMTEDEARQVAKQKFGADGDVWYAFLDYVFLENRVPIPYWVHHDGKSGLPRARYVVGIKKITKRWWWFNRTSYTPYGSSEGAQRGIHCFEAAFLNAELNQQKEAEAAERDEQVRQHYAQVRDRLRHERNDALGIKCYDLQVAEET